ncbi:MAG: hypothetical protein ACLTE2_05855 [Eubacteriales bacterium]
MLLSLGASPIETWKDKLSSTWMKSVLIRKQLPKSDFERTESCQRKKTGCEIKKGVKVSIAMTQKEIPIFVSDCVLVSYRRLPAPLWLFPGHDARDWGFAKKI